MPVLSVLLTLLGCAPADPIAASPACDELLSARTVPSELLLHGVHDEPLPETSISSAADFDAFLLNHDLPELSADFRSHRVLVTNGFTGLDCEYIDDTVTEPELVRLDDGSLGVIAWLATASSTCMVDSRALPMIFEVPAEEQGEVSQVCTMK